jgi:GTP-binding protein HflX
MLVLHEIGADQVPQVLIFNKLDAMDPAARPRSLVDVMELEGQGVTRHFVSAHEGTGLPGLRVLLAERVLARDATNGPDTPGESPDIVGVLP